MDRFWHDVRYALRMLTQKPAFAAVTILTLALGIGSNTAIFSIFRTVLLDPLPYSDPNRLVFVHHGETSPVAPRNFLDWKEECRSLEQMTAAEYWTPNLTGRDQPEQIFAVRGTSDLFPLLGVSPFMGRTFGAGEDRPDATPVVVLGHGLWQRRFGADPQILGQTLTLDGRGYMVVGIMPPGFEFPIFWANRAEMWAPLDLSSRAGSRGGRSLRIFARLAPGASLDQARAEMDAIARRQAEQFPRSNDGLSAFVSPVREVIVGDVRTTLLVLLAAVGVVLLIACVNVANLLLARASGRQREIAIRQAVGASRVRIVRQLLTESLVLAVLGGAAGLLLAGWSVSAFVGGLPAGTLPRQGAIELDGGMLVFTLFASLVTGILFGLAPAWRASRPDLNESLQEGGRQAQSGAGGETLRRVLVVAEVAMAIVLLVGAGLLLRSFARLHAIDPGFSTENLLTMTVSVSGTKHAERPLRIAFFQQLLQRLDSLPGVESVGAVNHLPLNGDMWGFSISIEGRPEPAAGRRPSAIYRVVYPGYFSTMGISILRGGDFTLQDDLQSPRLLMVNETMARRLWPGEDPLGKRIKVGGLDSSNPWMTVSGVVRDTRQLEWTALPWNEMYLPWLQESSYLGDPAPHFSYLTVVLRTAVDPLPLAAAARRTVWDLDKDSPVSALATMSQVVAEELWRQRASMFLMGAFAFVAMLLAAVGIFGILAFAVEERRQEIGIRFALGARPADIMKMVLGRGLALTVTGIGIGLAAACFLTRYLSELLYEVSSTDEATFAAVALLLAFVAMVACYLPARRATKIDPMASLR